jgi:hypothetical protein
MAGAGSAPILLESKAQTGPVLGSGRCGDSPSNQEGESGWVVVRQVHCYLL